jgi:hypothetical protein
MFTLNNLFGTAPFTAVGTAFDLICDGIQNPKTRDPTSSWSIMTFDHNGCGIERLNQGLII